MNHLFKFVQFYKSVKENDVLTVEKLINSAKTSHPLKQIKFNDFIFNYYHDVRGNEHCPFCFESLDKENNPLITFKLNNDYYYLKIKEIQILNKHIEISNIVHTNSLFDINNFKLLSEIFPSIMIVYTDSKHVHYDLGLIEAPILNRDATNTFNNVFLVDWILETYLIKEKDFLDLVDEYNNLNKKINDKNKTYIFYKRGNKYYLYTIIHNENITSFECIGFFNSLNENDSLSIQYNKALNRISLK